MSESKATLRARAEKLRKQIAEAEARLDNLKARLAPIEARLGGGIGEPVAVSGLDLLWNDALPIARNRSSKVQCRTEWNRIPPVERPKIADMLAALKAWNRCPEWRKDGSAYVPALHRWIKNRQWETPPETQVADSRYRGTPKAIPQTPPEEAASPEDIAAILSALKPGPPRVRS